MPHGKPRCPHHHSAQLRRRPRKIARSCTTAIQSAPRSGQPPPRRTRKAGTTFPCLVTMSLRPQLNRTVHRRRSCRSPGANENFSIIAIRWGSRTSLRFPRKTPWGWITSPFMKTLNRATATRSRSAWIASNVAASVARKCNDEPSFTRSPHRQPYESMSASRWW